MSTSTEVYLRPDQLTMPIYQRDTHMARVAKLAKSFNPAALGAITVSKRDDGTIVVIDGGHRVAAAREVGYSKPLLAIQYEGLTVAEEADMFLSLNDSRLVTAVDKFKAGVIAGEPLAVTADEIIRAAGWTVEKQKRDGTISAASAVMQIMRQKDGDFLLAMALDVITGAWGHDSDGVTAYVLRGVVGVLTRYDSEVSPEALTKSLARVSPLQIAASGKHFASSYNWNAAAGCSAAIVVTYNRNRRSGRIADWVWAR